MTAGTAKSESNRAASGFAKAGTTAVRIVDLQKHYFLKGETVRALRGVTFEVPAGDYVAIMGPSGSGKSTLLNLLGCLDRPTSGSFFLAEDNVAEMNDDQLSEIRASRIGFVFQSYNLIQQLTVVENIEVPLYYMGRLDTQARDRCKKLAKMVGLGERLDHRPTQLSGGQQQRVAIARSLVNNPYFILADEATGNLDSVTTEEILAIFQKLNDEGRTIIMVTHEDEVSAHAKRVIRLKDGQIQSDLINQNRSVFSAERLAKVAYNSDEYQEAPAPELAS
jgi:putative ABC transport system ATP-binding protein